MPLWMLLVDLLVQENCVAFCQEGEEDLFRGKMRSQVPHCAARGV